VPHGSQQRNDLVVFHSLPTYIAANLAQMKTPPAQFRMLTVEDIFVQD
jgi:hypothetical protein